MGVFGKKIVAIGLYDCIRTKRFFFRAKWFVFGQKLLYSGKVVVFGQSCSIYKLDKRCCNRAKVVVIGQKWFYSGKSGSIRAKWLYSSKSGCNPGKSG